MPNALEALLVDEASLHDELLASLLQRFVNLTSAGGLVFRTESDRLSVRQKVLIGVLGGMALHRLGKRNSSSALPKEIEGLTGLQGGTLRPALRALEKAKLLRSQDGRYEVPPYAIESVRKALAS
jgi:DNA-binding MarR family transcriptional regulator